MAEHASSEVGARNSQQQETVEAPTIESLARSIAALETRNSTMMNAMIRILDRMERQDSNRTGGGGAGGAGGAASEAAASAADDAGGSVIGDPARGSQRATDDVSVAGELPRVEPGNPPERAGAAPARAGPGIHQQHISSGVARATAPPGMLSMGSGGVRAVGRSPSSVGAGVHDGPDPSAGRQLTHRVTPPIFKEGRSFIRFRRDFIQAAKSLSLDE